MFACFDNQWRPSPKADPLLVLWASHTDYTQRLIKESQFLLLFLLYQLLSCLGIDKWLLFIHIHYPLSITFIENHSAFTQISFFLIEAIFNSFFKRNVANIHSSETISYYYWLLMQSKLLNIHCHRNVYILEDFLPHMFEFQFPPIPKLCPLYYVNIVTFNYCWLIQIDLSDVFGIYSNF